MEKELNNLHDRNFHADLQIQDSNSSDQNNSTAYKFLLKNSQLINLLEDELKDIYWSEKVIAKSISKMIQRATSNALIEALEIHLEEKAEHIKRVENAFELIEKEPAEKKCKAVLSLIEEGEVMMFDCAAGVGCDEAIISAGKKVEHYEIGVYGTLYKFVENLGLSDVASILKKTLIEEIAADKKLSEIAACIYIH